MQINLNFEGDLHVDSNNLGESHICTFGRYEKGALLVESDAGTEQREETLSFATYETLLNRVQHGIAGAKAGAWHYPGRFGLIRHFVSESVLIILVWLKKCTKTKEDQGYAYGWNIHCFRPSLEASVAAVGLKTKP